MAFFKFRQRGQSSPPEPVARGKAAAASASPQETVDGMRRRARHRLVGAAVLVLAAIIGFPLLFDTQPRPVAVNAPITIPDKDKAAPLKIPDPVPAVASLGDDEEVVPASAAPARAGSAGADARAKAEADAKAKADQAAAAKAQAAQAAARAKRDEEARAAAQARRDDDRAKAQADAQARRDADAQARREADARARREQDARVKREAARARALLEGRGTATATTAAAGADKGGRFIVQVGAFADDSAVREARRKAESAGVRTYTQVVNTKDGRRTRVRVGPFASREEAQKAAVTLKKAGLSGAVLAL